jgi:hypothetical protein
MLTTMPQLQEWLSSEEPQLMYAALMQLDIKKGK